MHVTLRPGNNWPRHDALHLHDSQDSAAPSVYASRRKTNGLLDDKMGRWGYVAQGAWPFSRDCVTRLIRPGDAAHRRFRWLLGTFVAAQRLAPTLVFSLLRASLWRCIDSVLALSRQRIELSLAFSQRHLNFAPGLALRWHFVPTPCLPIMPQSPTPRASQVVTLSVPPMSSMPAVPLASAGSAPVTSCYPPRSCT